MVSLGQILFWWNKQSTQFPFGAERKRWYSSCDCFSIHWTELEALKYLQDITGGWGPYHDFCVREIITAISVDLKNSWQTVDHSFTAQDVRGVHLSIIHKQLHEENRWFVSCCLDSHAIRCDRINISWWDLSVSWENAELEGKPKHRLFVTSELKVCL